MSLHTLANHLQSAGRNNDSVLVHMTPREVQSLQTLAMAHGGSLTINPQTGLPEAGFLSSLLPILAGAFLGPGGMLGAQGFTIGALSSPMSVGLLSAGIGTLATGSLGKGLMMGLGAYGGAGLSSGLFAPSAAAQAAASQAAAAAPSAAASAALDAQKLNVFSKPTMAAPASTGVFGAAPAGGTMVGGSFVPNPTVAPNPISAPIVQSSVSPMAGVNTTAGTIGVQEAVKEPSMFDRISQGAGKFFGGGQEGEEYRKEFLSKYGMPLAASGAAMYMLSQDQQRQPNLMQPGAPIYPTRTYSGEYTASGTPGLSGERQYTFLAEGGLADLPVEKMSEQASTGANTNYPMANIRPYGYAVPRNVPISENVFKPMDYQRTDPYTGEQKFAEGGIVALATGGFISKLKAVAKPPEPKPTLQSTAALEKQIANLEKYSNVDEIKGRFAEVQGQISELQSGKKGKDAEAAQAAKDYNLAIANINKERTANLNSVNADFAARIKEVSNDKSITTAQRQAAIAAIQKEQKQAQTDISNEFANRVKERQAEYKGYQTDLAAFNKDYSAQLAALNKDLAAAKTANNFATQYTTAVTNRDKMIAANEAATAKAQATYDAAMEKYNQYQEALAAEKQAWEEETGRKATGLQALRPATFESAESLQKKINDLQDKRQDALRSGNTSGASQLEGQIATLNKQLRTAGQYKPVTQFAYDPTTRLMEAKDITAVFEDVAGRRPTAAEMDRFLGTRTSDAAIASFATKLPDVTAKMSYTDDDLRENWQYYTGREPTGGELAAMKRAKLTNFNQLRDYIRGQSSFLENVNRLGLESITAANRLPIETVASTFRDLLGRQPTAAEIDQYSRGQTQQSLIDTLKQTEDYKKKFTQGLIPQVKYFEADKYAPGTVLEYRPETQAQTGLGAITGLGPTPSGMQTPQTRGPVTIQGAMPLNPTFQEQLGLQTLAAQAAQTAPALQRGLRFDVPTAQPAPGQIMPGLMGLPPPQTQQLGYEQQLASIGEKQIQPAAQPAQIPVTATANTAPVTTMAMGGYAGGGYHLGDYSDGGRLLKGPGDGVSDSIPASIGDRQPARLADGEFVIPARIVSELGNGSTDAGARQLYAMMDRIQRARRKSIGKGKVAVDGKARAMLPA